MDGLCSSFLQQLRNEILDPLLDLDESILAVLEAQGALMLLPMELLFFCQKSATWPLLPQCCCSRHGVERQRSVANACLCSCHCPTGDDVESLLEDLDFFSAKFWPKNVGEYCTVLSQLERVLQNVERHNCRRLQGGSACWKTTLCHTTPVVGLFGRFLQQVRDEVLGHLLELDESILAGLVARGKMLLPLEFPELLVVVVPVALASRAHWAYPPRQRRLGVGRI